MPYHNSDKRFEKYQNIAFMPLDIPYEKLNLEELQVFSDRNYIWPPDIHTNLYGNKKNKQKIAKAFAASLSVFILVYRSLIIALIVASGSTSKSTSFL